MIFTSAPKQIVLTPATGGFFNFEVSHYDNETDVVVVDGFIQTTTDDAIAQCSAYALETGCRTYVVKVPAYVAVAELVPVDGIVYRQ